MPKRSGAPPTSLRERRRRVAVEGGVLDPLGGDGTRDLLESPHEVELARPAQQVADELEDGRIREGAAALGFRHGLRHVAAVLLAGLRPLVADVGPVDGKARDDLAQPLGEAPFREVAGLAATLGEARQAAAEHVQLAGHGRVRDEPLRLVDDVGQGRGESRDALIRLLEGARPLGVDEQAVQRVQELVARGPVHGPVVGKGLARHQHLLDHDVERNGRRRGPPRPRERLGARRSERLEIARGRVETVGVVDPEPRDPALADQVEQEPVRRLEHGGILHPDRRQVVDVEEPPVVDLVPGDPPVRDAIRLRGQHGVEPVEALRLAGSAVHEPDHVLHVRLHRGGLAHEGVQPALDQRRVAPTRGLALRVRVGPLRQTGGGRHDGLELPDVRVGPSQPVLEIGEPEGQDLRKRAGIDREDRLVVADEEAAVLVLEPELALLEDPPVVVPQDRKEDPVPQLRLERLPVDVEERGELRRGAVLEHVLPPGVPRPDDAHVVRDHVDQLAHPVRPEGLGQRLVAGPSSEGLVERPVVGHIVAVGVARAGLEDR